MKRGLFLVLVLGMFQGTLLGATAEPWEIEQFSPGDVSLQMQHDKTGRYIYGPAYATALPNLEDPNNLPFDDTSNLPEGFLVKRFPGRWANLGWTLNAPSGKYYIGLQIRSDSGGDMLFAAKGLSGSGGDPYVYLNEQRIIFSTMTAPVELLPGQMAAELQSQDAMDIKPGDRIRVANVGEINNAFVVNLILYTKSPVRGPILCGTPYDESTFYQDWDTKFSVEAPSSNDSPAVAKYTILNVANRPLNLSVRVRSIDYYQKEVVFEKNIEIKDLETFEEKINFIQGDGPWSRIELEIRDLDTERRKSYYDFISSDKDIGPVRRALLLNGTWEAVGIPRTIELGNPPAEEAKWKEIPVPSSLWGYEYNHLVQGEDAPYTHVAWMRKRFKVPEWMNGKRYELYFEKVSFEAQVYVNGKRVGSHIGDRDPFSFDVTEALVPGEINEILVGLRDAPLAVRAPEVVKTMDLSNLDQTYPTRSVYPCLFGPAYSGAFTGIGGDVWLKTMPQVFVEDVFIIPSVRKKTLTVEVTIKNNTNQSVKTTVLPSVWEAGEKVFDITSLPVNINPNNSMKVTIIHPWVNPHLWHPRDPHLYELRVALKDGDLWRDRFGFREFWTEGNRYYLNGKIAKLWRISSYIGDINTMRDSFKIFKHYLTFPGCLMIRPRHGGTIHLSLADEAGMLAKPVANINMGANDYILKSEEYWANSKRMAQACTKAWRNHPSVVMYEGSNEFWCFAYYVNLPNANDIAGQRLEVIGKAIREVDPTKPIIFDAEADLGERWDTIDCHYSRGLGDPFIEPNSGAYLPDSAYHRSFDKVFVKGEPIKLYTNGIWFTRPWGEKPISHGEIGEFDIKIPHDGTLIDSDRPFRAYGYMKSHHIGMIDRFWNDGVRDMESAMVHPWENIGVHGTRYLSLPPLYINLLNTEGHYWSGEEIIKSINIHHDVWEEEELTFRWSLIDGDKRYMGEDEEMSLSSGQLVRKILKFQAPKTNSRLDLTFRLELLKDSQSLYSRDYPLVVYPSLTPNLRVPSNTVLYDPNGETSKLLKDLGTEVAIIQEINADTLKDIKVLIIGSDGVDQNVADNNQLILRFVEQGGRVVAFEQGSKLQWLPISMQIDIGRKQSYNFPRVSYHPVLKGLVENDLQLWQKDRVVAINEYRKPQIGSYLPLIDSGGREGLEWSSLVEVFHGKGSYLLCQMLVTEKTKIEPIAFHLLKNILEYAGSPVYRPKKEVALIGKQTSNLSGVIAKLNFKIDTIDPVKQMDLSKYGSIIVDGEENISQSMASDIAIFASNGGKVMLHNLTPETASIWSNALEIPFSIRPVKRANSNGHAMLVKGDSLIQGISGHELFWHQLLVAEDDREFSQKAALDKLFEYECVISQEKARILTFPSVLVNIPVGKGEIVIDQTRWDRFKDAKVKHLANRIGSYLLTNLGAAYRPTPPVRPLPAKLSYMTIDLSSFANRSLTDEVSGDGEGGWSDQGNRVDMRSFPTGNIEFKGVSYLISTPKSCIVLNQKGAFLELRGIPINDRVESLYFLHSGAWISATHHVATYVINYIDGGKVEIPLIGDKNIRDWAYHKPNNPFSGEDPGIITKLVWTGDNPTFPIISVYSMEWINPEPDREIKSVDFIGTVNPETWGEGAPVPVLMALTAAKK